MRYKISHIGYKISYILYKISYILYKISYLPNYIRYLICYIVPCVLPWVLYMPSAKGPRHTDIITEKCMYRAFYSSSDLLFVVQLHSVGGNFNVRLSICPIRVRYNSTVQHVGDCVICWLEKGRKHLEGSILPRTQCTRCEILLRWVIWHPTLLLFFLSMDAERATLNMKTKSMMRMLCAILVCDERESAYCAIRIVRLRDACLHEKVGHALTSISTLGRPVCRTSVDLNCLSRHSVSNKTSGDILDPKCLS